MFTILSGISRWFSVDFGRPAISLGEASTGL
jgi:hypothetical protein